MNLYETNENVSTSEASKLKEVVPTIIEETKADVLVIQTGSSDISNVKVNEVLVDTSKNVDDVKEEWFSQVEKNAKEIVDIANCVLKKNPEKKVILIKRLPRYDRSSNDIIGIKTQLSTFANTALDQAWTKIGKPKKLAWIFDS